MAQVVAQGLGVYVHPCVSGHAAQGGRHLFGTAEQSQTVVGVDFAVAAKADGHIRRRQHGRQQGAFGGVEGIKLIDKHGAPGKKVRLQTLRCQLLAVGGVHDALPQK